MDQHILVFMLNRIETVSLRGYLELLNKGRRRVDIMYLTTEVYFYELEQPDREDVTPLLNHLIAHC